MVLPGYNTDFKYKGQVYHAQTEDNGVSNPVVVTLLYLKGAILSSNKTSYKDLLEKEDYKKELVELMKNQHRGIMKEVLAGKFDTSTPEPAAAVASTAAAPAAEASSEKPAPLPGPKSLDEAIMEYLAGYGAGKVQEP